MERLTVLTTLPEPIYKRLRDEFALGASKVSDAGTVEEKNFYFSVFFGEIGRQLNTHWEQELALVWAVTQILSTAIGNRVTQATGTFPLGGFPIEYMEALDQISAEIAGSFEKPEIDSERLYAALSRASALAFVMTGNGAYLYEKGFATL